MREGKCKSPVYRRFYAGKGMDLCSRNAGYGKNKDYCKQHSKFNRYKA